MVFSMFNAGLLDSTGAPVVLGLALAYGGIVQLLAGMWEFRRGNTFGAVVFGSNGAFWLSYWLLEQFFAGSIPGGELGSALALFYISWAIVTALLWIASTQTTAVVSLMLFLLTLTYLMLGIGDAGAHERAGQDRRLVRARVRRHRPVRRPGVGHQQHGRADAAAARPAAASAPLARPDGARPRARPRLAAPSSRKEHADGTTNSWSAARSSS